MSLSKTPCEIVKICWFFLNHDFNTILAGRFQRYRGGCMHCTFPGAACVELSLEDKECITGLRGLAQLTACTATQKKSQGTLRDSSSRFSFSRPTIVLLCPGAPIPWLLLSYQWTVFTVKASMFQLQKLAVAKMLRQQKTVTFSNFYAQSYTLE
jgi:hypothetical protein